MRVDCALFAPEKGIILIIVDNRCPNHDSCAYPGILKKFFNRVCCLRRGMGRWKFCSRKFPEFSVLWLRVLGLPARTLKGPATGTKPACAGYITCIINAPGYQLQVSARDPVARSGPALHRSFPGILVSFRGTRDRCA